MRSALALIWLGLVAIFCLAVLLDVAIILVLFLTGHHQPLASFLGTAWPLVTVCAGTLVTLWAADEAMGPAEI